MRIGVFDSGLGGLFVARAIAERLPQYDYLYLGDTKRVPYGNRSQATIHEFVGEALNYLFQRECQIIILACNTASAESLRKSQQEYLPVHYPDRRVLGVVIPTAEAAVEALGLPVMPVNERPRQVPMREPVGASVSGFTAVQENALRIGVLATASTVESNAYARELDRCYPGVVTVQQPAPLLVPLVENDGLKYADPVLDDYLATFNAQDIQSLILGCTHYAALKDRVRTKLKVPIISTDEIVPEKLADYLQRHPEIESKLSRTGSRHFEVTDLTDSYLAIARRFAGEDLDLQLTTL